MPFKNKKREPIGSLVFKICDGGNRSPDKDREMMLDNLKFSITDQNIIQRLLGFAEKEMIYRKPQNNNYVCYSKFGALMRFDFRKIIENGCLVGFRHLEVSISPHYHFNNYLHNGNDFKPLNCIKTLEEIFIILHITNREYDQLKVVNIEYGLNLIPNIDVKNLIEGISFHKRTPFIIPDKSKPYFKITDATKYKQIKAYAKGLQFIGNPELGIDPNAFRLEVKSKQSKCIVKIGINTVKDLFNIKLYDELFQSILEEWESVLYTHEKDKFKQFLKDSNRDKFNYERQKYMKINQEAKTICRQIKGLLIDKFLSFQNSADSTQKTFMNKGKVNIREEPFLLINLEYAEFNINIIKNKGLGFGTSSV